LAAAVFMVGGVFFTTGGYASVLQVANAPREAGADGVVRAPEWRWWSTEPGRLDWAGAVALGSALFMAAGIAAFVRPETGDALAVGIANWATFSGAACFAAAGVMQEFERP
jgi:hypothetical protein